MNKIAVELGRLAALQGKPSKGEELLRAVRAAIAAEYEAIELYTQIAESATDAGAKKVFADVVAEEKKHVGEFQALLFKLAPEEKKLYAAGAKE